MKNGWGRRRDREKKQQQNETPNKFVRFFSSDVHAVCVCGREEIQKPKQSKVNTKQQGKC